MESRFFWLKYQIIEVWTFLRLFMISATHKTYIIFENKSYRALTCSHRITVTWYLFLTHFIYVYVCANNIVQKMSDVIVIAIKLYNCHQYYCSYFLKGDCKYGLKYHRSSAKKKVHVFLYTSFSTLFRFPRFTREEEIIYIPC